MSNLIRASYRAALICMLAGMISSGAAAQDSNASPSSSMSASKLSAADKQFIREAAAGGLAEVELGQLAVDKGSSAEVKKFGQRMVDDHSKANDQLKQLAASKDVTVPTSLDAKDKATKAHLSSLSGDAFDKAYMADMVKDHKKDVAAFRRESHSAQDTDVKSFAAETLPTLEQHLQQAQSVAPAVSRSAMQPPSASQR